MTGEAPGELEVCGLRVLFHTFGCKVNQYDSESLANLLRERGHEVVQDLAAADVVVVNTCTVTKEGERKARQWIRQIAQKYRDKKLVVTGCYAQTNPEELASLPGIALVTGVKDRESLVDWVDKLDGRPEPAVEVSLWSEQERLQWHPADFPFRTRAFLKIEDGCSANCSYCKVPQARGPVRSLAPDKLRSEFARLLAKGHREIVLAGIHLGCYGQDLGTDLTEAVEVADGFAGDYRFRLSSVEPTDFTPALLEALKHAAHLCPHLHIPLQSGSRTVLRRMGRDYSPEQYGELLTALRSAIPGLAVTTDVIVGFPGETEEEFQETMTFVAAQAFSGVHVFPFSRREGTAAYYLPEQIPRQVKQDRSRRLIRLAEELGQAFLQQFPGRTIRVLVEEHPAARVSEGFSEHYLRTKLTGEYPVGSFVLGRVTGVAEGMLLATPVT